MNFYDVFMFPLEQMILKKIRKELISHAQGDLLEIGFGTGANLKFYNHSQLKSYKGLDIKIDSEAYPDIDLVEASVSDLPFEDKTFDTVIATLVFCSVEDLDKAIKEVHRVLKDDGIYLFLEHVQPTNKVLSYLFNKINKPWHGMAFCHLIRNTDQDFKRLGFEFVELKSKSMGIIRYGIARKKY